MPRNRSRPSGRRQFLHRKRVQRKRREILQARARFDHGPGRLHSRLCWPGDARQMTPLRPAAIAIHNDGDVLRETVGVQISGAAAFLEVRGFERFGCFHAIIPANPVELRGAISRVRQS